MEKARTKIKFSIWDLVVATTFVCVIFAFPLAGLKFLAGASLYAIILLGLLSIVTIFVKVKIKERSANAERFLMNVLWRGFFFSVLVLTGSLVAISVHFLRATI